MITSTHLYVYQIFETFSHLRHHVYKWYVTMKLYLTIHINCGTVSQVCTKENIFSIRLSLPVLRQYMRHFQFYRTKTVNSHRSCVNDRLLIPGQSYPLLQLYIMYYHSFASFWSLSDFDPDNIANLT